MPCLRRQGLGLPLRGAQLRGMQGRKMSPREYFSRSVTKSWINQENNHHYDICVHWKSSSLTKCAVDAVIASIKCFCIVPIMRFSGPRSHATIPCTFTKRLNCVLRQRNVHMILWTAWWNNYPFQGLRVSFCQHGKVKGNNCQVSRLRPTLRTNKKAG